MGFYVHIHVCFPCQENEPVAQLALRHLPSLQALDDIDDGQQAAIWFLEALSERKGTNPGPKGGLSLWGMVGNYTNVDSFCEVLRPFWRELLTKQIGGICPHERIVVFEEREQSEAATAYEIALSASDDERVIIRKHARLPFSWMQM